MPPKTGGKLSAGSESGRKKGPKYTRGAASSNLVAASVADALALARGSSDALKEVLQEFKGAAADPKEQRTSAPAPPIHPDVFEDFVVQVPATPSRFRWLLPAASGLVAGAVHAACRTLSGRAPCSWGTVALTAAVSTSVAAVPALLDRYWRKLVPVSSVVESHDSTWSDISKRTAPEPQARGPKQLALAVIDSIVQTMMVASGVRDHWETGLVKFTGFCQDIAHRSSEYDTRLTNLRGNPAVKDRVPIYSVEVLALQSAQRVSCVASPEVVNQVVRKLFLVPSKDREVVAIDFASRVTNLAMPAYIDPDVVRGSGMVAALYASSHDVSVNRISGMTSSFLGAEGWKSDSMASAIALAMASPLLCALITVLTSRSSQTLMRLSRGALFRWRWGWSFQG